MTAPSSKASSSSAISTKARLPLEIAVVNVVDGRRARVHRAVGINQAVKCTDFLPRFQPQRTDFDNAITQTGVETGRFGVEDDKWNLFNGLIEPGLLHEIHLRLRGSAIRLTVRPNPVAQSLASGK